MTTAQKLTDDFLDTWMRAVHSGLEPDEAGEYARMVSTEEKQIQNSK